MDNGATIKKYGTILKKMYEKFKDVPFDLLVETFTGHKVMKVTKITKEMECVGRAADRLREVYGRRPLTPNIMEKIVERAPKNFRPNEAGLLLEHLLAKELC